MERSEEMKDEDEEWYVIVEIQWVLFILEKKKDTKITTTLDANQIFQNIAHRYFRM
jgi:hypothetical protein